MTEDRRDMLDLESAFERTHGQAGDGIAGGQNQSPSGMEGAPQKTANAARPQHTLIPFLVGLLVLSAERIYVALETGKVVLRTLAAPLLMLAFCVVLWHDWTSGRRRFKFRLPDVATITTVLATTIVIGHWLEVHPPNLRSVTLLELMVGLGMIHWLRDR